jgi:hypothetical protein
MGYISLFIREGHGTVGLLPAKHKKCCNQKVEQSSVNLCGGGATAMQNSQTNLGKQTNATLTIPCNRHADSRSRQLEGNGVSQK